MMGLIGGEAAEQRPRSDFLGSQAIQAQGTARQSGFQRL